MTAKKKEESISSSLSVVRSNYQQKDFIIHTARHTLFFQFTWMENARLRLFPESFKGKPAV